MLTKASAELTLFDTLSRLTFARAGKLLGAEGTCLITAGENLARSLAALLG